MKQFKPNLLTLALMSSGLTYGAVAQAAEADTAEQDVEVIQVKGFRASLQKAQAIKMGETSIVEALSAEDIGKLPDTSVAESLARLPGLAGERRNGRTSGLSVRGFNENYVGTSLNGRELLGMGDNRGVEYDLYPSEIINNVVVYKTPEAGVLSQGIGGTVDLQTVKPLLAEETITFNANIEQNEKESGNPDFDNQGHRFSFNYVDKFMDDKLGVALAIASLESPRQEQQFRGWGYANVDADNDRRDDDTVDVPADSVVLGGHDSFTRSALLKRDSIATVIEFAPSDDLSIRLDALYIDFEENDARRGLEEGGAEWSRAPYTITGVETVGENSLVTSGFYDGFHSVIRNDVRKQEAELTTFGLNVEYTINDNWEAVVDLSTGEVDKEIIDVESYSGVGRAGIDGRPAAARSWQMTPTGVFYSDHPTLPSVDYTNPDLIRLAGPKGWGGALGPVADFQDTGNGFGPSSAQDGFVNQPVFNEQLDSMRLELNGFVDWSIFSKVDVGLSYKERLKSKFNGGAFLTSPVWPSTEAIPNVLGVADLSFIGIDGVLAYDSLGLYTSGYYQVTDAAALENGRQGDTYIVEEDITTLYGKLTIDTELAGMFVKGNLGLQVVSADQSARGFDAATGSDGITQATPVSGGDSYTDILPTLNLSFEVAEDQFVRTALSKVQSRPRMDQMKPNTTVSFQFNNSNILSNDIENSPWSGETGNPILQPLEANQFDLSYENYYADTGYFAVSFFFKDLTNWHREDSVETDFSDFYIPGYHKATTGEPPVLFEGHVDSTLDGLTGLVRGYEFQGSLPFEVITDTLDGFGIFASYTLLDGGLSDGGRVPGLSDETYSMSFYYEQAGFEFRISGTKRSDFLTETRGMSLALTPTVDQGGELWDAQIGYDFSESGIAALDGLRVTLQAQNLTDEDTVQSDLDDPRQITQYQSFGANYLLGINYTF